MNKLTSVKIGRGRKSGARKTTPLNAPAAPRTRAELEALAARIAALKPLAGWDWDRVTAQLKTMPARRDYLRVREEPNKLRLLADRIALGEDGLAAIGLRVAQEDTFFVEPRLEATGVNARESLAA